MLPRILRLFYRTDLRFLPVVDSGSPSPEDPVRLTSLQGFIARDLLDSHMADLDRARRDLQTLPEELLIRDEIPEELITRLARLREIPVLNDAGEEVFSWSSAQALRAFALFREKLDAPPPENKEEPAASQSTPPASRTAPPTTRATQAADHMCRIILAGIHYPLFASDLNGATLFYNSAFEQSVLNHPSLKRSIRLSEKFLQEITRDQLARAYERDPRMAESGEFLLRARVSELDLTLEIRPLRGEGGMLGYLYVFSSPDSDPVTDRALLLRDEGLGLEEIMDRFEASIIHSVLKEEGRNISHSAQSLRVKRSTLQNRIKRLRLHERLSDQAEGPVRRRRKNTEASESPDPVVPEAAEPVSKKSPEQTSKSPARKVSRKKSPKTSSSKSSPKKTSKKLPSKSSPKKPSKKLPSKSSPKKSPKKLSKSSSAGSPVKKKAQGKTASRTGRSDSRK